MENVSPFNKGNFFWKGTNEEFLEFVMIIADFVICARPDVSGKEPAFNELCDDLAQVLIKLLNVNIAPFQTFAELREGVKPSYNFSKKIVKQLKQINDDEGFFEMLENANIMPSYETMRGAIAKWKNVEAFTNELIKLLRLSN